jgi:hypothetical protein
VSELDFRKFRGQAIKTHEANGGFPKRMFLSTHIQHWPIDRLIPYARNARTHSTEQVAQVAASIREFGFTSPILIVTSRPEAGPDRSAGCRARSLYRRTEAGLCSGR